MAVDHRNFLLNTDFPIDKIIYKDSGSFSATSDIIVGGGLGTIHNVAHGLGFMPLIVGNFSTSPDFLTTNEIFMPIYPEANGIYGITNSSTTEYSVQVMNYSPNTVTVYYRVYGFMPSNVAETAVPTSALADNFVLNTDYNYSKLYYNDVLPDVTTTTITHNLGYRPQVMAWMGDSTQSSYIMYDSSTYITVTDTTVVAHSVGYDIYLRIYKDSQV